MLTPVDIQQKKFRAGIGYDKKDVNAFFEEVSKCYEELYRSNADLKEQVVTLTDGLQHYKTTEDSLQKSLMIAEKNKQESRNIAAKEAKNIELEAKNRANEIVNEAYEQLEELENRMKELETRYAEYKSAFATIVKMQFDVIEHGDFDPDAMIDPNFAGMSGMGGGYVEESSSDFGSFGSDPQMRESSGLGGGSLGGSGLGGAGSVGGSRESRRSNSSNVYGSTLGGDGIDPFGEGKKSGASTGAKTTSTKTTSKVTKPDMSKTSAAGAASSVKSRKEEVIPPKKEEKKEEPKKEEAKKAPEPEKKVKPEPVQEAEQSEEDSLVGDIQEKKVNGKVMLEDPTNVKSEDEDDDGFEFI